MNFAQFLDMIQSYESDTFSASAELITNEEKIKIGNKLLDLFTDQYIDGTIIKSMLEEVKQDG